MPFVRLSTCRAWEIRAGRVFDFRAGGFTDAERTNAGVRIWSAESGELLRVVKHRAFATHSHAFGSCWFDREGNRLFTFGACSLLVLFRSC